MEQRKLKVYAGSGKNYAVIPQIILQGQWLGKIDFNIGDKITVDCQPDKIIITKEPPLSGLEN